MRKTISGIQKIYVASYEGILDVAFDSININKGIGDIYETHFTRIIEINNALDWIEIPNHNGVAKFTEKLIKDRKGLLMHDVLNVSISKQTLHNNRDLYGLVEKPLVIVFQDNNHRWWIIGYDVHIELKIVKQTTDGSNQYDLEFEGYTLGKLINSIDYDYVYNEIINAV